MNVIEFHALLDMYV